MIAPVKSAQFKALDAEKLQHYQRDGYLLIKGFLNSTEVAELRDTFTTQVHAGRIDGLFDDSRVLGSEDPLKKYPRLMHPHRYPHLPVGPVAMRYLLDKRINDALWDLFGEEPIAAQSMFYFKPPGARGQALHQDNFYLRVKPGTCMAAWIAVDAADRENGGLIAVPGSHAHEVYCPEKADASKYFTTELVKVPPDLKEEPIDMQTGDCLFFNGSVIHGSSPNVSNRFRRAFIGHYVPRSSVEVSGGYRPLLTFDGQEVAMSNATGGGPCGTFQEATSPH